MINYYAFIHKFETLIQFLTVWVIAVLSAWVKPIAAFIFYPLKFILLDLVAIDILKAIESYWHLLTVIGVAILTIYSINKTRKETRKIDLETKLKEKELQNYDMDHKFDELRLDIMFAEEKLAAYKAADEKLKNIPLDKLVELVNREL